MTTRKDVYTHVLFENYDNNELIIAPFDMCHIRNDDIFYTCDSKVFRGKLYTVSKFSKSLIITTKQLSEIYDVIFVFQGPKSLCDTLMKQTMGSKTEHSNSSLSEEEEDTSDDIGCFEDRWFVEQGIQCIIFPLHYLNIIALNCFSIILARKRTRRNEGFHSKCLKNGRDDQDPHVSQNSKFFSISFRQIFQKIYYM